MGGSKKGPRRNSPAYLAECEQVNDRRLRGIRNIRGYVPIRFMTQIRDAPAFPHTWGGLRGQAFAIVLDEVVDVWDLLRDIRTFVLAWRPMRRRTEGAQRAASDTLARWVQLGRDVR